MNKIIFERLNELSFEKYQSLFNILIDILKNVYANLDDDIPPDNPEYGLDTKMGIEKAQALITNILVRHKIIY